MADERARWRVWLTFLLMFMLDRLVFVDETATYTRMHPRYGYAKRGRRVLIKYRIKATRYTLIGAMGIGGMLAPKVLPRAMNEEDWVRWVIEDLLPTLKPGSIIIWDNLNIHFNRYAIQALQEAGHAVLFQSRYSPELNPIEKAWSKIKTLVRKARPRGAAQLRAAIEEAWQAITLKDIDGYFSHVADHAWEPQW